ncbi:MAG: glycosyl transferase family 28 [Pseudomonadota bacterium]
MSAAYLDRLAAHLDASAADGRTRAFWWRDDDATAPGPRLAALLARGKRHGAAIAIAAIPEMVGPELLALCEDEGLDVLQHGIAHRNHQPAGKAAELGDARSVAVLMEALLAARARLKSKAFTPVLVPPWNRMRADLAPALEAAGYRGVSLFGGGPVARPRRVDTHIDPIAWRTTRSLVDASTMGRMIDHAFAQDGPIGLLTHHIVHDSAVDGFVDAFAAMVAGHPGADWVRASALFEVAR